MLRKHTSYLADALVNLGWAALLRGDPERARTLYAESMRRCLELGDTRAAPETLLGLAYAAEARGEAKRGDAEWQEVWAEGRVMSFEEAVSYALDEEEADG